LFGPANQFRTFAFISTKQLKGGRHLNYFHVRWPENGNIEGTTANGSFCEFPTLPSTLQYKCHNPNPKTQAPTPNENGCQSVNSAHHRVQTFSGTRALRKKVSQESEILRRKFKVIRLNDRTFEQSYYIFKFMGDVSFKIYESTHHLKINLS